MAYMSSVLFFMCLVAPAIGGQLAQNAITGEVSGYCSHPLVEKLPSCLPEGASKEACVQKGCCYNEDNGACKFSPGRAYFQFSGEKTTRIETNPTAGISSKMCAYLCDVLHARACSSYVYEAAEDKKDSRCHLVGFSRNLLRARGQIKKASGSDVYSAVHRNADDMSFISEKVRIRNKLYLGCFAEKAENRDLPYLVKSKTDYMTFERCSELCRDQSFTYAGLQNGGDCYCGNSVVRLHGNASNCDLPCPGDNGQSCGGENSNAIYHIKQDRRYIGCYDDNESARDLSTYLWGKEAGFPAHQCVKECLLRHFKYAGVQNGGACFCGDTYGHYGAVEERKCVLTCEGYGMESCGGLRSNAIYLTEKAYDLTNGVVDGTATKLYDGSGQLTGISSLLFTFYPGLRSYITDRLIIHTAKTVLTPAENEECASNCHATCGEIENESGLANMGDDVVLRFFHFKLSDLPSYIGSNPKRVYLYVQTLIIDSSIQVDFSLSIRATRILLDRSTTSFIGVSSNTKPFNVANDQVTRNLGPHADLIFQKQSFMCGRILMDSKDMDNMNTAWGIFQEIARSQSDSAEQDSFQQMVRTFMSELAGIDRVDVNYVPIYSKSHLAEVLKIYHDTITVYKTDYDALTDKATSNEKFLNYARDMNEIYTSTDLAEANAAFQDSVTAVEMATATYVRMDNYYVIARQDLGYAEEEFRRGIKKTAIKDLIRGMITYLKGVAVMAAGIVLGDPNMIAGGVKTMIPEFDGILMCLDELRQVIHTIDELAAISDENLQNLQSMDANYDSSKFVESVELAVSLEVSIVQWKNLKHYSNLLLSDPQIASIPGAAGYSNAIMDLSNWGEALTKSMVEKGETMRKAMEQRAHLDSKIEQKRRVDEVIAKMENDYSQRELVLAAMMEQTYDVRIDMNTILLQFCQAYFYENLEPCSIQYKPSFGGSLTDLLLKLNAARRDDLLIPDPPSTTSRIVKITDTDTDPNCNDALLCPVNYFKNHRKLYFPLDLDHPELSDLHRYRVAEVYFKFIGAKNTTSNTYLQVRIDVTGEFHSQGFGHTHKFVTKPLALAYEYDVNSGHVSIHADVYHPYRNIINHMTPYTNWILEVYESRSADIDLSGVTSIEMQLDGSANIERYDMDIQV